MMACALATSLACPDLPTRWQQGMLTRSGLGAGLEVFSAFLFTWSIFLVWLNYGYIAMAWQRIQIG